MTAGPLPSWEVMILNYDGHTPVPLGAARPGHGSRSMGSAAMVREAIDSALADVDWSNPAVGVLDDAGAPRIELDLGGADPVEGFLIHVRGARGAADLIAHLCLVNGWAALDCAHGTFLDLDAPDTWPITPMRTGAA